MVLTTKPGSWFECPRGRSFGSCACVQPVMAVMGRQKNGDRPLIPPTRRWITARKRAISGTGAHWRDPYSKSNSVTAAPPTYHQNAFSFGQESRLNITLSLLRIPFFSCIVQNAGDKGNPYTPGAGFPSLFFTRFRPFSIP
jgi:hypothetical protein